MGLHKKDKIAYLRISDGKIRAKSVKEDPDAEERYVEIKKEFLYEKVYSDCEGYLRDILIQTHEEYGTTYNLVLYDPEDGMKYALAINESSRYFSSLAMHLPNFDFSKPLLVKPYSFTKEGQKSTGISFQQNGEKVPNFYREWNESTEVSKPKNGLEKFNFAKVKKSKEDTKILQMQLLKFLKNEMKAQLIRLKEYVESHPIADTDTAESEPSAPPVASEQEHTNSRTKNDKKSSSKKGKKKDDDDLPY